MPKSNQPKSHFKNRYAYLEWRCHWRRRYREISNEISMLKSRCRYGINPRSYQSVLAALKCEARAMMIGREAVRERYVKL